MLIRNVEILQIQEIKETAVEEKKKGRLKGLIAAELIVVVVLVMIVGHNLGLGTGITNFVNSIRKPAVEELDITGINSLMRCS